MITTTEIARDEWLSFFDTLSRLHQDEPVRIEVLREDIGAQLEVRDLPLDGITADRRGQHTTITIAAGADPARHVSHLVSEPVSVRIARRGSGDDDTLEIVEADRTVTLVSFEAPKGWSRDR